jgi:hypothetical protein
LVVSTILSSLTPPAAVVAVGPVVLPVVAVAAVVALVAVAAGATGVAVEASPPQAESIADTTSTRVMVDMSFFSFTLSFLHQC